MPRLIDANELERRLNFSEEVFNEVDEDGLYAVICVIDEIPTVDAEPVRHGHWIKRSKVYPDFPYDSTYYYECSNCGYMDMHNVEVPYCWHCGAKMDGERKDK